MHNIKKHNNIAIFVPHNGCPHQCSFCNQRTISGHDSQPSPEDVKNAIEISEKNRAPGSVTQLAFFGGSFTAIDRDYMISLLEAAEPYFERGSIDGIRCSTRPDCVDTEILALLRRYHVTAVELGAQSMRDSVLEANHRGHNAADVEAASGLILENGFELGLQMMTGLYASSESDDIYTAERLIALGPATVRIYPTVVLRGTELARLYEEGKYSPLDALGSAPLCSLLMGMFERAGIRVIRVGLHAEKSLEENCIAGAYHPAMRELCESAVYLRRMRELLAGIADNTGAGTESADTGGNDTGADDTGEADNRTDTGAADKKSVRFSVNPRELSKALGQKRCNISVLKSEGYDVKITADSNVETGDILIVS